MALLSFPQGVIATRASMRKRFPYITQDHIEALLKVMQVDDTNRWFLKRYKIQHYAGSGFEWQALVTQAACIEHMLREYCIFKQLNEVTLETLATKSKIISSTTTFAVLIAALYVAEDISEREREILEKLRITRNGLHIHNMENWLLSDGEHQIYDMQHAFFRSFECRLLSGYYNTTDKYQCMSPRCAGVTLDISSLSNENDYLPRGVRKKENSYFHHCNNVLHMVAKLNQVRQSNDPLPNLEFEMFDEAMVDLVDSEELEANEDEDEVEPTLSSKKRFGINDATRRLID